MTEITVRKGSARDIDILHRCDTHISEEMLKDKIACRRILIAESGGEFAGWLRYGMFWDEMPFINMLYVLEKFRGKGIGTLLVTSWEQSMRSHGYSIFLTSTQAEESAQHFFRKQGYSDLGGFFPFGEGYELIMGKKFDQQEHRYGCR